MRCPKPIGIIDPKTKLARVVPCGQCAVCRINYALDWAFRNHIESQLYDTSNMCFVTLTYSDDSCTGSLSVSDLQGFYKRMRSSGLKFRYFGCGEYGTHTHRPHYHLILYGVGVRDDCWIDRSYCQRSRGYFCKNKFWPFGHCFIGSVTPQSIAYCCKYTLKAVKGKLASEVYDEKGLKRPFCSMSRRPGIGSNVSVAFLKGNNFRHFSADVLANVPDLNVALLPRYYFDQLFPKDSEEREIFKDHFKRDFVAFFGSDDDLPLVCTEDQAAQSSSILRNVERQSEVKNERSHL